MNVEINIPGSCRLIPQPASPAWPVSNDDLDDLPRTSRQAVREAMNDVRPEIDKACTAEILAWMDGRWPNLQPPFQVETLTP